MSANSVIDVGLGLVLMYLVLSLICTIVNEYISDWTKMRAKTLAFGLSQIIDDAKLLGAFQNHGLISASRDISGGQPSYLGGRAVAVALLQSLDPGKPIVGVADVRAAAEKLPDSNIRDVVLSAVNQAGDDLDRVRDALARWYDDSMDRLSGVYRRYARKLSLAVGIALAAALNADTISVSTSLWRDGSLRAQIANVHLQPPALDATRPVQPQPKAAALQQFYDDLRPFPIGWTATSVPFNDSVPYDAWLILVKILGILITGLALSLGAPFWFDVLNKFINIRGSGAKPARTPPEVTVSSVEVGS